MTRRKGYTLVELLVVAVLAVSLLGIAAAGYRTWVKATATDASATRLLADLERARAYALARACATRIRFFPDERGDLVLVERRDVERNEAWHPVANSNRLARTHVESPRLHFRPDGSCCTNEALLAEEADFAEYGLLLKGASSKSGTQAVNQPVPKAISVNARTGLAKILVFTSDPEATR